MAIGVDEVGVSVDSADYTVDGTFIGVAPGGGLFLSAFLTARNVVSCTSSNVVSNTSSNVWSG